MCLRSRQHISAAPRVVQLREVAQLGTDEIMHQSLDSGPRASLSSAKGRRIKGVKIDCLDLCSHANVAAVPTPGG